MLTGAGSCRGRAGIESGRRIQDIEILRGLAIIMVLAEHVSFNLYKWNTRWWYFTVHYWHGASGVDLFLAVSGFVIARGLLPKLADRRTASELVRIMTAFLVRRFWRLQPSALTWLIVPLLLSVTFNRSGAFHTPAQNIPAAFASLLAVNNLWSALSIGKRDLGIFFPYWSLSLEEQFYLLLPIAAVLLGRRLPWLLAALVVYQFFFPQVPLAFVLRPGALAAGVLLAIWSHDDSYVVAEPRFLAHPAVHWPATFLAIILLGSLQSQILAPLAAPLWGLLSLLAALLVYAASFDKGYIVGHGLPSRLLVWFGSRSYAIYLVHVPAYALVRELFWRFDPPPIYPDAALDLLYLVPALLLTVLLAEVTHRLVERPARRFGRRLAGRIEASMMTDRSPMPNEALPG